MIYPCLQCIIDCSNVQTNGFSFDGVQHSSPSLPWKLHTTNVRFLLNIPQISPCVRKTLGVLHAQTKSILHHITFSNATFIERTIPYIILHMPMYLSLGYMSPQPTCPQMTNTSTRWMIKWDIMFQNEGGNHTSIKHNIFPVFCFSHKISPHFTTLMQIHWNASLNSGIPYYSCFESWV